MRTLEHRPKMKLSLTNKSCYLFEWTISSAHTNETSSDIY